MEHIINRHILPVGKGKSYFLSHDVTHISNMIQQTVTNPDKMDPHKRVVGRKVHKKIFPVQIGVHGYSAKPCYSITAIIDITNNQIVTAFPTL